MARNTKYTGLGIALGAALGAALGVAAGHVAVWLAVGVAIGLALGSSMNRGTSCPACAEIHTTHESTNPPQQAKT